MSEKPLPTSNRSSMEKHVENEVDREAQPSLTESAGGTEELSGLRLFTIILALVLSLFLVDLPPRDAITPTDNKFRQLWIWYQSALC